MRSFVWVWYRRSQYSGVGVDAMGALSPHNRRSDEHKKSRTKTLDRQKTTLLICKVVLLLLLAQVKTIKIGLQLRTDDPRKYTPIFAQWLDAASSPRVQRYLVNFPYS